MALFLGRRGFEARTAVARWVRHAGVGGWGDFDAGLQQQRRPGAVRWRSLATRASPTADPEKLTVVKMKEILDAAGAWPEGLKRSAKKAELVAAVREAMMPTGGGHDAAPTPSLDESPTDHEPSVTAGATAVSDEDPVEVLMDMREPGQWYSLARGMRREVHLHVGPTNSGKTYSAIQRLKASESGVYCSPLRLLAWEVAEGLNNEHGVPCDMITGQEKKPVSGARHVACTVEMADTRRVVDVAVIDEAHLMGDPDRGYAFTRAILGLPAKELHLCGDPAMVPLVQKVIEEVGDELTVHRYTRLQPLKVLDKPLRSIKNVRSGDCLVAFSRKAVHQLKRDVEKEAALRACVIYGSLPPEARARQAELFNDRASTGYDVLIASDAIGMGLNLSIKRVVFTTVRKFDGEQMRLLEPPEVKQIAGRAGRYGQGFGEGGATTMVNDQLPILRDAIDAPVVDLTKCSVAPTLEQVECYLEAVPGATLVEALTALLRDASLAPHYFMATCDGMIAAAKLVEKLPLSVEDHWMFAVAPANVEDGGEGAKALLTFADTYAKRGRVGVRIIARPPHRAPETQGELNVLEQAHAAYDLYLWFSMRHPDAFPERDLAQALRQTCAAAIELGLQRSSSRVMEREWDERRKGGEDVGYVDKSRLRECVDLVKAEEERLAAAGFGYKQSDEDGIYGTVKFTAKFKGGGALTAGGDKSQRDTKDRSGYFAALREKRKERGSPPPWGVKRRPDAERERRSSSKEASKEMLGDRDSKVRGTRLARVGDKEGRKSPRKMSGERKESVKRASGDGKPRGCGVGSAEWKPELSRVETTTRTRHAEKTTTRVLGRLKGLIFGSGQ